MSKDTKKASKGKAGKATKEVKKAKKVSASTLSASEGTQALVKLARKLVGATSQQSGSHIKVYIGERPLFKLTGITKEEPNLKLYPRLRFNTLIDDDVKKPADRFKAATGLLLAKNWEPLDSGFVYVGEYSKLPSKLKIVLPKLREALESQ